MTTHNHMCPKCGRVWGHGDFDCSTGTSYLMDCPEETPKQANSATSSPFMQPADHAQSEREGWATPRTTQSVKPVPKATWWRWLLVVPAAVGTYLAVQLGGRALMWLISQGSPDSILTTEEGEPLSIWRLLLENLGLGAYVVAALKQVIAPLGFVFAGAATAPSRQFGTMLVLTLVMIAVLGMDLLLFLRWIRGGLGWGTGYQAYSSVHISAPLWWLAAMTVLGIGVLVYVCLNACKGRR